MAVTGRTYRDEQDTTILLIGETNPRSLFYSCLIAIEFTYTAKIRREGQRCHTRFRFPLIIQGFFCFVITKQLYKLNDSYSGKLPILWIPS